MAKFKKPTIEEAKSYADSIGFTEFDAEKWFAVNDTVGWVVGKARTPMKNWKGSIRTWFCNWKRWNPNKVVKKANGPTLKEKYLKNKNEKYI